MFSFQIKVSPKAISGKIETSPERFKERLVLAPFRKPVRIEFKNVVVGSVVKRLVVLENPANLPTEVELYQLPPVERNVTFNSIFFKIKPFEKQYLEISWSPLKEGNWRDVVRLHASGSLKLELILLFSSILPPRKVTKRAHNMKLQNSVSHYGPSLKKCAPQIKKQVRWGVTKHSPTSNALKRNINKGILTNSDNRVVKNISERNLKSLQPVPILRAMTKVRSSECSSDSTFGSKTLARNLLVKRDAFANVSSSSFPPCDVTASPDRRQTYDIPVKNKENFSPCGAYAYNVFATPGSDISSFSNSPINFTLSNTSNCFHKSSYSQAPSTPLFLDSKKYLPDYQSPISVLSRVTKDILSDFQLSPCVVLNNTQQAVVRPFNMNLDNLNKSLDKITLDNTVRGSAPIPKTTENDSLEDNFPKTATNPFTANENVEEDSLEKSAVIPETNDSVVSDFVGFLPDERSTPIGNRPLTPIIKDCSVTAINSLSFTEIKASPLSNPKSCVHFPIAEEDEVDLNITKNSHTSKTSEDIRTHSNSDTFILTSPKRELQRDSVTEIYPAEENVYSYSESTGLPEYTSVPAEKVDSSLSSNPDSLDQTGCTEFGVSKFESAPPVTVNSPLCGCHSLLDQTGSTDLGYVKYEYVPSVQVSSPLCSHPDDLLDQSHSTELETIAEISNEQYHVATTEFKSPCALQSVCSQPDLISNNRSTEFPSHLVLPHSVNHNGSANVKPFEPSSKKNPGIVDHDITIKVESEEPESHLANHCISVSVPNEEIVLFKEKELLLKFGSLLSSTMDLVSDKEVYCESTGLPEYTSVPAEKVDSSLSSNPDSLDQTGCTEFGVSKFESAPPVTVNSPLCGRHSLLDQTGSTDLGYVKFEYVPSVQVSSLLCSHPDDLLDQSHSTELETIAEISNEQYHVATTEFKSPCALQSVCSQPDLISNNRSTELPSHLVLPHSVNHNGSANVKPIEPSSKKNPDIVDHDITIKVEPEEPESHLANHCISVSAANEEIVLFKEKELLLKFGSLLSSTMDLVSDKEVYCVSINATDLWNEIKVESCEVTIEQIYSSPQLNKIRQNALKVFESDECVDIVKKVETVVNSTDFVTFNEGQSFLKNSELKCYVIDLLLNYEPVWLRIGLETIFNCEISVVSKHDIKNVTRFLKSEVLLESPECLEKPYFSGLEGVALEAAVNKFILKMFLLLVSFLDIAKKYKIMPHNPCLFLKNAKYKESYAILIEFASKMLSEKDQNLQHLEQTLQYAQNYLDEFDYSLKCLTDFSDGICLVRVAEILLHRYTLSPALYAPAVNYVEKLHNVNVALAAFKNDGFPLPLGITAENIATANKEKIIFFLSHLVHYYKI